MEPIINGLYQGNSIATDTTVQIPLNKLETIRHWKSMGLVQGGIINNNFELVDTTDEVTVHSTASDAWYKQNKAGDFDKAGGDLDSNPFKDGLVLKKVKTPPDGYKWIFSDTGEFSVDKGKPPGQKYAVIAYGNATKEARPNLMYYGVDGTQIIISAATGNIKYYQTMPPLQTAQIYGMANQHNNSADKVCSITPGNTGNFTSNVCIFDETVYFTPKTVTEIKTWPVKDMDDNDKIDLTLNSLTIKDKTHIEVTISPVNGSLNNVDTWESNIYGISIILFVKESTYYIPYEISHLLDDLVPGDSTTKFTVTIDVSTVNKVDGLPIAPALTAAYPDLTKIPGDSFAAVVDLTSMLIIKPVGTNVEDTNKLKNYTGMSLDECFYNKILSTRYQVPPMPKIIRSIYYMLDTGKTTSGDNLNLLNTITLQHYAYDFANKKPLNKTGRSPCFWVNSTAYGVNNPSKPFVGVDPTNINCQQLLGGIASSMIYGNNLAIFRVKNLADSDTIDPELFSINNLDKSSDLTLSTNGSKLSLCQIVPIGYTNVKKITIS